MKVICIAQFGKSRIQGQLKNENHHTVLMELPKVCQKKKKYVKRHIKKHDVSLIRIGQ